jgi:hypothetical protein
LLTFYPKKSLNFLKFPTIHQRIGSGTQTLNGFKQID